MAFKTQGQAGVEFKFEDLSTLPGGGLRGVVAAMGPTERGAEPKLVSTWQAFQEAFGGFLQESHFPLYCRRALQRGGTLLVVPIFHYLNINDPNTRDGAVAEWDINETSLAETLATGTVEVLVAGSDTEDAKIVINNQELASYTIQSADDVNAIATGLDTALNAGTATHGFTSSVAGAVITITAPTGSGASLNGEELAAYTTDGSGEYSASKLTGGISAAGTITWGGDASSPGEWANNKLWVKIEAAADNTPNEWDISVGLDGYPTLDTTIPNVPSQPSSDDIKLLNARQGLITFDASFTGDLRYVPKTYFTGGSRDITKINTTDYIGRQIAGNGLFTLDERKDFWRICAPDLADPQFDAALSLYVNNRKGISGLTRTPVGLGGSAIVDYSNGNGAWNHDRLDDERVQMFTGGLYVNDPASENTIQISEIGDIMGVFSKSDQDNETWFSKAGPKRGTIQNALGVVYDLRTPSRSVEADAVSIARVNAVVNHERYGIVLWDNMTMARKNSLFKFANVVDLFLALERDLTPLIEQDAFDPNDVTQWKAIFRRVTARMDAIQRARGVFKYKYEGDQFVEDPAKATVNSPQNIDAGLYQFNLFIAPTPASKFYGVKVGVTNSGVNFDEL